MLERRDRVIMRALDPVIEYDLEIWVCQHRVVGNSYWYGRIRSGNQHFTELVTEAKKHRLLYSNTCKKQTAA